MFQKIKAVLYSFIKLAGLSPNKDIMKIIESKITIDTPIDKVWQILADFENYHHWNPFTPKIELTKEIGTDVMLHVRLHPKSKNLIKQKETLLHWEEGKQMDWGITDAWYVRTVRTQYLK